MGNMLKKKFNNDRFIDSLKKRNKPQKEFKNIMIKDKLIKNVPVLKDDKLFEHSVSSDTLDQIYHLIDSNPQKNIIYFK